VLAHVTLLKLLASNFYSHISLSAPKQTKKQTFFTAPWPDWLHQACTVCNIQSREGPGPHTLPWKEQYVNVSLQCI